MPVPWQRGHAGPKGTAVVHGSISASNVAKELQTSSMNDLCEWWLVGASANTPDTQNDNIYNTVYILWGIVVLLG